MSILYSLENYTKIIEKPLGVLTSGTTDCGNGVYLLKAGTPIRSTGVVANNGNAKWLVAEDFYFYSNTPNQPKVVKLIEKGYVDLAKAQAAAGITYASAAKSALATAGIILVDGALETGGSSLPDASAASQGDVLLLDENKDPEWSAPPSGLPDASTASAGDVLALDANKDPEWATPSGGGGALVVTFTKSGGDWSSDKTKEQIYAAYAAGKNVYGKYTNLHTDIILRLVTIGNQVYSDNCAFLWEEFSHDEDLGEDTQNVLYLYWDGLIDGWSAIEQEYSLSPHY